jgi:hypothetical protein
MKLMYRRTLLGVVALCWLLTTGGCAEQTDVPPGQLQARLAGAVDSGRAIVARQAEVELLTWELGDVVRPEALRIEAGPIVTGVTTYRAWLPRSHWHPYVVAMADGQPLPLGGFTNPELPAVSRLLSPKVQDERTALSSAMQLVLLADVNGGVQCTFPYQPESDTTHQALGATWKLPASRASWLRDTVVARTLGGWSVRITVLSRETKSYTMQWLPFQYAFAFDKDGVLEAWSRRQGEPFSPR